LSVHLALSADGLRGAAFFDQDANFVGSRVTSNIGAGPQAAMFFCRYGSAAKVLDRFF
jgi:hypothetical protein